MEMILQNIAREEILIQRSFFLKPIRQTEGHPSRLNFCCFYFYLKNNSTKKMIYINFQKFIIERFIKHSKLILF